MCKHGFVIDNACNVRGVPELERETAVTRRGLTQAAGAGFDSPALHQN